MQTLTWEEIKALKGEVDGERETKQQEYPVPHGYSGVNVVVHDDKESVLLTVDNKSISLPIEGARSLALALRQSANRVEKEIRQRR